MPKSSPMKGSTILIVHLRSRFERGIAWGCLAGACLGFGLVLDIDLSDSAVTFVYVVLVSSSATGALFGHLMAGMLAHEVAISRIRGGLNAHPDCDDLSEHKALKLQMRAQHIALHISSQLAHAESVSIAPLRPAEESKAISTSSLQRIIA